MITALALAVGFALLAVIAPRDDAPACGFVASLFLAIWFMLVRDRAQDRERARRALEEQQAYTIHLEDGPWHSPTRTSTSTTTHEPIDTRRMWTGPSPAPRPPVPRKWWVKMWRG